MSSPATAAFMKPSMHAVRILQQQPRIKEVKAKTDREEIIVACDYTCTLCAHCLMSKEYFWWRKCNIIPKGCCSSHLDIINLIQNSKLSTDTTSCRRKFSSVNQHFPITSCGTSQKYYSLQHVSVRVGFPIKRYLSVDAGLMSWKYPE